MPAVVRTRWSREAPVAWVAAVRRGAPVTAAQHNAMVATIAAVRDALAEPFRARANPDDANPTVGLTPLRREATAADLAAWDALGRVLTTLRMPPSTRGHYATDDAPTAVVTVGGIAADALVPDDGAMYLEAPAACAEAPALVRDTLALILRTQHAASLATAAPAAAASGLARAASAVADLADRAQRWMADPRNRERAAVAGGVGLAAAGAVAVGATARRKRKDAHGSDEEG